MNYNRKQMRRVAEAGKKDAEMIFALLDLQTFMHKKNCHPFWMTISAVDNSDCRHNTFFGADVVVLPSHLYFAIYCQLRFPSLHHLKGWVTSISKMLPENSNRQYTFILSRHHFTEVRARWDITYTQCGALWRIIYRMLH